MNFRKNMIASFTSQMYISFVAVVMLPFYIKHMGAEAYGLVGFFAMLQVLFNFLDFGLTPTVSREMARFYGKTINAFDIRQLFRSFSCIFIIIAATGGCCLFLLSGYISEHWLKPRLLSLAEVQTAVEIMVICAVLRWICGLYRSVVTGAEKLVWLGGFNVAINTLRFVLVLPVMIFFGATPKIFFLFQLSVAIIEILGLLIKTYELLPSIPPGLTLSWSFSSVKSLFKFSITLAMTSSIWIIVTQMDKLVLSHILPLDEYGYFSLAALVSSGVILIASPVSMVLMPRMARLEAENDQVSLIRIYRQATQLSVMIAGSLSITLFFCAKPLLLGWIGNYEVAVHVSPILSLYALGNGIFVLAAFPYYLQYAKGDLHLHLIGHLLLLLFLIPLIVWSTIYYGAIGAGIAWITANSLYFIFWVPLIHRKFISGWHQTWLLNDIVMIFLILLTSGCFYSFMDFQFDSRSANLISVLCFGAVSFLLSGFGALPLIKDLFFRQRSRGDLAHVQ